MPTPKKIQEVELLTEKIEQAKGIFLTDFTGLTVEEMTDLRARLRKENIMYRVTKNTLMKRALEKAGHSGKLDSYLEGPTGLAFGFEDPVSPAKILKTFAKEKQKLKLKASLIEGQVFGAEETERLAELPSKQELQAQLLAVLNAPATQLVRALTGNMTKLLYALQALKEKKEKEAA